MGYTVDELEQLKDELENLQSNVVFAAFVTLGARFISVDAEGDLVYKKNLHLAAFKMLGQEYDNLAEQEEDQGLKEEIQDLTEGLPGENP